MADGQRKYPVNEFFVHHSTGPDFANAGDTQVQDWYDEVGRVRGYQNGALRSYHQHPTRNKETYAMAHLTLRPYTLDGNKYGWRLTELIADPMNNVAWHCGNWEHNQRSLSVEVCGNWLSRSLPDKALMLLADYIRPQDQTLNGGLTLWAHKWVFATACPGALEPQIDKIVDMLNNPAKWNAQLWPAPPAPAPVPTPEPAPTPEKYKFVKLPEPKRFKTNKQPTNLWDISYDWPKFPSVKTFAIGEPFIAVGYAEHSKGSKYYMTSYSFGNADVSQKWAHPFGVNIVDLTEDVAPAPVEPPVVTPPVVTPPVNPPVEPPVVIEPTPTNPETGKDVTKQPFIEALKSMVRLVLLALPGIAIAYFTDLPATPTIAGLLLLLKGIDKYVHENPDIKLKGISPV